MTRGWTRTICFWLYNMDSKPMAGRMPRVCFHQFEQCPCNICSTVKAFLFGLLNGLMEGDKRRCDWNRVVVALNNFTAVEELKTMQRHIYAHIYENNHRDMQNIYNYAYNYATGTKIQQETLHPTVQLLPRERLLLHRPQCLFDTIKWALFLKLSGL